MEKKEITSTEPFQFSLVESKGLTDELPTVIRWQEGFDGTVDELKLIGEPNILFCHAREYM